MRLLRPSSALSCPVLSCLAPVSLRPGRKGTSFALPPPFRPASLDNDDTKQQSHGPRTLFVFSSLLSSPAPLSIFFSSFLLQSPRQSSLSLYPLLAPCCLVALLQPASSTLHVAFVDMCVYVCVSMWCQPQPAHVRPAPQPPLPHACRRPSVCEQERGPRRLACHTRARYPKALNNLLSHASLLHPLALFYPSFTSSCSALPCPVAV